MHWYCVNVLTYDATTSIFCSIQGFKQFDGGAITELVLLDDDSIGVVMKGVNNIDFFSSNFTTKVHTLIYPNW